MIELNLSLADRIRLYYKGAWPKIGLALLLVGFAGLAYQAAFFHLDSL